MDKEKKYKSMLKYMLSNKDFETILGSDVEHKIYKYKDLSVINNIYDILPNKNDYAIILTQFKPNQGHWTCLVRYQDKTGDTICYFDSYGKEPDYEESFVPKRLKKLLFETKEEITRLMMSNKSDNIYNNVQLQCDNKDVCTCGRWTVCFIKAVQIGLTLEDFINKISDECLRTGKPTDLIVCEMIPIRETKVPKVR